MTIRLGKEFVRVGMVNPHGQGSFGWASVGDGDTYEMYFDLHKSDYESPSVMVKVLHKDLDGRQDMIFNKEMEGKELSHLPRTLEDILRVLTTRGVPPEDTSELSRALEGSLEQALEKKVSLAKPQPLLERA